MITLLGDIHGDVGILHRAVTEAHERGSKALIQIGDFGLFQDATKELQFKKVAESAQIPIYFIDGNHDDCTRWAAYIQPFRVFEKGQLIYIPRGYVMEIDGRTIAFMGGAASIDKALRGKYGWHWDARENIVQEEIDRLLENASGKTIDVFITHCPPGSVIEKHFDPMFKLQFGVPIDWADPNQAIIEDLWHKLGDPFVYSGHMHRTVRGENFMVIDINDTVEI